MSIADKLNYLITTKQLLKTEINKINNVLDDNSTFRSYPQELFNGYLDILNNGTDTLWNNLEKVSQTGTEAVLEGVETAPMKMVLNGNTSQDGTPTPDTPVEVKVVTGENVVSVQGKNLIPNKKNNVTSQGVTFTANEDGTYLISGKNSGVGNSIVTLFSNQNYILEPKTYYTIPTNNEKVTIVLYVTYEDNTNQYININRGIQSSVKINKKVVKANAYLQVAKGTTETYVDYKVYPILTEKPVDVDTYVPYSKTDYPISLGTIELCKINTYKDYFHKDSGNWYVHKEIGKTIYNGTEEWNSYNNQVGNFTVRVRNTLIKSGYSAVLFCDYFRNTLNGASANKGEVSNTGQYYNINFVPTDNLNISSTTDWKNWLSTYNIAVYYPLATPTEEEITDTTLIEQLEAISKAKSVKDKTYITQTNDELPFILDVEAIKEYSVE